MPLKFNYSPYWDDYDASKGFYKILSVPGRALQSREVTQAQTISQEQIKRGFDGLYTNGTVVKPGNITYDNKFRYVKLNTTTSVLLNLIDPVFQGAPTFVTGTSGIRAQVKSVVRAVNSEPNVVYLKYLNSADNGATTLVLGEEVFSGTTSIGTVQSTVGSVGVSTSASISPGVYYISGRFVDVAQQTIILDSYTDTPSFRVGLNVVESVVTYNDDSTLFDNAQGSPSFSAPGADRYKIALILTKLPLNSVLDANFIELLRLNNGVIEYILDTTKYSILDDTLARRTNAQSGDFVVNPFQISVTPNSDSTKLSAGFDPGYAFVKGYEVKTVGKATITLDKARDTQNIVASRTRAYLGSYFYVNSLYGFPTYNTYDTISLMSGVVATPGGSSNGTAIGTARVRSIEQFSPGIYKLFVFNVAMTGTHSINEVLSFYWSGTSVTSTGNVCSQLFVSSYGNQNFAVNDQLDSLTHPATIQGEKVLTWDASSGIAITQPLTTALIPEGDIIKDHAAVNVTSAKLLSRVKLVSSSTSTLVYKFQNANVASVRTAANAVNASYTIRKTFTQTTPSTSSTFTVTFSAGSGETFIPFDTTDYVLVNETGGNIITLSGANTTITTSTVTISLPSSEANSNIKFSATIVKTNITEKTKTLTLTTVSVAAPALNTISLGKPDIYKIVSITEVLVSAATIDITDRYVLDNGQRDDYYGLGNIQLIPGKIAPALTSTLAVTFQYFQHSSSGDYFTVNSYTSFDGTADWYSNIPSFKSISGDTFNLRDCVDVRPRINDAGSAFAAQGKLLAPGTDFISDFSFYLGRTDLVYITAKGEFKVIKGVSAVTPEQPSLPSDGTVLYILNYNPYVYSTKDVSIKIVPNKRYQNTDIGKLDTRIGRLEKFATLSLLEQSTANLRIVDPATGLDRFKNGFIADGFIDQSVVDTANVDFKCSIDYANGLLRPHTSIKNIGVIIDALNSSHYEYTAKKATNNLLSLPYTELSFINQPYATGIENVNPFSLYAWNGTILLSPSSDDWMDTSYAPDIISTDTSQFQSAIDNNGQEVASTVWDCWKTTWTGGAPVGIGGPTGIVIDGTGKITTQTRTGKVTTISPDFISNVVNNKVLNISVVPFIRSKYVKFTATRLKPNTVFFPFFDGVAESANCKPLGTDVNNPLDTTTAFSQTLKSDATGNLGGWFLIPAGVFKTGTKIFRLTDSSTNSLAADSFADATYTASGVVQTVQRTIVSTEVPVLETQTISENRSFYSSSTNTRDVPPYGDPICQAILISGFKTGVYLTSLDLFFGSKDSTLPVTVQLRELQNGTPTQTVLPLSEVTILPINVNISNDGSVLTKVNFKSPVFLQNGVEYGITILANSDRYTMFVGELGKTIIGGDRIVSSPPYAGAFFKSQNGSTWVPAPNENLKFVAYRAVFDTTVQASVNFVNTALPTVTLGNLPFFTSKDYTLLRIFQKNHGLLVGSTTTITVPAADITNAVLYNGIPASQIGSHTFTVVQTELDAFVVDIAGTAATSSGKTGPIGATITTNVPFNTLLVNSTNLLFPGTSIKWNLRQTNASYNKTAIGYDIQDGINIQLSDPSLIASPENEALISHSGTTLSDTKSLVLNAVLTSELDNLSPVLDLQRLSLILIANRISASNPNTVNVVNFDDVKERRLTASDLVYSATDNSISSASLNFVNAQYRPNAYITLPSVLSYARIISVAANKIVLDPDIAGVKLTNLSGQTGTIHYYDHFTSPYAAFGTYNESNYVTRTVSLEESANAIHIFVDVYRPEGTTVDVYAKYTSAHSNIITSDYVKILPSSDTDITSSSDRFKPYIYQLDNIAPEFVSVEFKIELKSNNSGLTPLLREFKAIMLGT